MPTVVSVLCFPAYHYNFQRFVCFFSLPKTFVLKGAFLLKSYI